MDLRYHRVFLLQRATSCDLQWSIEEFPQIQILNINMFLKIKREIQIQLRVSMYLLLTPLIWIYYIYIYVYCNLFHLFSIFQESWTPRWIFPSWKDSPFTLHTSLTASGIFNLAAFWFPLGLVEFGLSNLGPAMAGHVFGCVGLTGYGREKKVTRNKNAENWQMFGETIWYFICFF